MLLRILQMHFLNLLLQKYNNNCFTWVHNRDFSMAPELTYFNHWPLDR